MPGYPVGDYGGNSEWDQTAFRPLKPTPGPTGAGVNRVGGNGSGETPKPVPITPYRPVSEWY